MECFRPIPSYPYLLFHVMCKQILFSHSFCVAFYFDDGEVLYHSRNRGRNRRVFFHRATPSRFGADPQQVRQCNSAHTMHAGNGYVRMCMYNLPWLHYQPQVPYRIFCHIPSCSYNISRNIFKDPPPSSIQNGLTCCITFSTTSVVYEQRVWTHSATRFWLALLFWLCIRSCRAVFFM